MLNQWIDLDHLDRDDKHPLAIIPVRVIGPVGEEPARSVIDTGSSLTIFPRSLLERLGLNFSQSRTIEAATSMGQGAVLQGDPLMIDLICWGHEAPVAALASDGLENPVLGLNDFFRHFEIRFRPGPNDRPQFQIKRPESTTDPAQEQQLHPSSR
jgi:predicted aspartyl protease